MIHYVRKEVNFVKFSYSFPAIRGYQAQNEFFTLMCPLGILSKLFNFYNNEIPDEFRAQRVINEKRIPEIREYILKNPKDYVFSSITASLDGDYQFEPFKGEDNIGNLLISMGCNFLINDGQHRKAAIDEAIIDNPKLKDESISVVLFVDKGLVRSQQMFSDLNRHAVNVSSSLSILYNHRDPQIELTKKYLSGNPRLKKYIDMSSTSLAQKSNKMFILSMFHNAFMNVFLDLDTSDHSVLEFSNDYWDSLCDNFNEWKTILEKNVSPFHSRKESISTYGVVLEALGLLGNYLAKFAREDWGKYILKLNEIDWSKTNRVDWQNRCIQSNGKITKSPRMVKLTYLKIKVLIELPLTSEEDILENIFKEENKNGN